MPITSRSFVRSTLLLLGLGFLALLAIVLASLWLTERTESYAAAVLQAREARTAIADLRGLLQDAETGQRGYLLTVDAAYLAPYTQAYTAIPGQIRKLRESAAPFSDMAAPLARLEEAVSAKLAELAETVTLTASGRDAEALAVLRTDRGKRLMDEARARFSELVAQADARFNERVAEQRRNVQALRWVSLLGSLAIVLVAGGAAWTVLRYTRELARARTAIEELNMGLEERVRERTVGLRRANEEIQRFAYIVTHDLRAPLVNIMGFTGELETSLDTLKGYMGSVEDGPLSRDAKRAVDEDVPEALGFIRSSTRKMDGLINAILKLSREGRRPLKPERIMLEAMLRASADAVRHQVGEAGGTVSLDVKVPSIVTDRLTLEQAFGNLLDNAVKYREPGRPLAVSVRALPAKGNRVAIEFSDNGRGIAEPDHERVFELFRRSGKQDTAGEGIGLAHVRSGIRNLGGDITVASSLGVGTTFTITLPRDLAAALNAQAA